MSKFRKKKKGMPGISTASLPDIVFMLLFFFMVTTVMRETDVLLPHLERFIVPGVSWIALGKGHFEDIRVPEKLGLDDLTLLTETLEPRLGKSDHILTAESEILIFSKPDLICHREGADKQDDRD